MDAKQFSDTLVEARIKYGSAQLSLGDAMAFLSHTEGRLRLASTLGDGWKDLRRIIRTEFEIIRTFQGIYFAIGHHNPRPLHDASVFAKEAVLTVITDLSKAVPPAMGTGCPSNVIDAIKETVKLLTDVDQCLEQLIEGLEHPA